MKPPSLEVVGLEIRNEKRVCKRPGKDIVTKTLKRELHERKRFGKHFRNLEPGYAGSHTPPKRSK